MKLTVLRDVFLKIILLARTTTTTKTPETQENLLPHQTKKPRSTLALGMI